MANVTEMPPVEESEIEDPATESAPQAPKPAKPLRGRPPKGQRPPPDAQQPQFFDRVASIPKEDWGVRAFMYVYADEPVCNKKTFGETRYMLKSSAPILDLERLKQDYGSFKGWMSLNLRKTGKDATDEVDRLNFEIYDPKHPPKIPRSAWANDDRNKRWSDLLPPETPPASSAATSLLDGIKVYKEIRDEVKDEMSPDQAASNNTRDTLETMKLAKELFGPAATLTPAESPLQIAIQLATTMMQMKADNPVIDMYRDELKAAREELKEANAEMRKAQQAPPAKGTIEQLVELANSDKLEPIKKLFTGLFGTGDAAGPVARAARMGTLEFFAEIIPKIAEAPIMNAWAARLMMPTPVPTDGITGAPALPPQPNPPPNADAEALNFMKYTVSPALLEYFESGMSGHEFAAWLYDGFPEQLQALQNFQHPMIPGMIGLPAIITAYRHTALWPRLSARGEEAFTTFVQEFCAWKPKAEGSPTEATAPPSAPGEPIDIDEETREAV